jgi:2-dehydropantoate 2-reductase
MIARGRRAEQIQKDGLRITGLAEFSEQVPTLINGETLRSARVLIVAMKALGTADALTTLRHADVESTFSIQNGVLKNELLGAVFGESRVLGALANISGEMLPGGEIVFTRNVAIQLGEVQGEASSRAQDIADTLNTSGVRAAAVVNIKNLEWTKFVAWAGLMALAVTVRAETWRYLTDTGSAKVLVRLVREMANLALALGIELTDDSVLPVATISAATETDAIAAVVKVGRSLQVNAPTHRVSSLQDLEAGRPLEIHETLGFALQQAGRRGLTLPLVETFYHLIAAIDGQRSER